MTFFRTPLGALVIVAALVVTLGLAGVGIQVFRATHPVASSDSGLDFDSVLLRVENVTFEASDGVTLSGSYLTGDAARPTLLLCHDWGQNRHALTPLALRLHAAGFNLLWFDFRGHGESERRGTTFGLAEKRDLAGAVEFLRRRGVPTRSVGVYGVGMGAFAALRAAEDRPELSVLVLDSLYPDTDFPLRRRVYGGSDLAIDWFGFLPSAMFRLTGGGGKGDAGTMLARLAGRDVLLLASDGDGELCRELQRMVERIPTGVDTDGNLVILPASQSEGLFGEHLDRYHARVHRFFETRLNGPAPAG